MTETVHGVDVEAANGGVLDEELCILFGDFEQRELLVARLLGKSETESRGGFENSHGDVGAV